LFSSTLLATIEPSTPEFSAIWRIWGFKRPEHDVDAGFVAAELPDRRPGGNSAPPPGTMPSDGRLGCVHRVVDAVLLLLDLDLSRTAAADHRNAARQLGLPLLQGVVNLSECRAEESRFS
jgi:hypothetical protein